MSKTHFEITPEERTRCNQLTMKYRTGFCCAECYEDAYKYKGFDVIPSEPDAFQSEEEVDEYLKLSAKITYEEVVILP